MRKPMRAVVLTVLLLALMSAAALAADDSGIKNVAPVTGTTLTPQTATGGAITPNDEGLYKDAARVQMTYSGATSGKFYLVLLLKGDSTTPTENNIVYIDQVTAEGAAVNFSLYPDKLENGSYTVCLYSNAGTATEPKVGALEYYQPYTLGDVNGDQKVSGVDASWILQIVAGKKTATDTMKAAADVNGDSKVSGIDASWILAKVAGKGKF